MKTCSFQPVSACSEFKNLRDWGAKLGCISVVTIAPEILSTLPSILIIIFDLHKPFFTQRSRNAAAMKTPHYTGFLH